MEVPGSAGYKVSDFEKKLVRLCGTCSDICKEDVIFCTAWRPKMKEKEIMPLVDEMIISGFIEKKISAIHDYASFNDGQSELESDIYGACELSSKAQRASDAKTEAEWLESWKNTPTKANSYALSKAIAELELHIVALRAIAEGEKC